MRYCMDAIVMALTNINERIFYDANRHCHPHLRLPSSIPLSTTQKHNLIDP